MRTIHLDQETDRRLTELATATGKQPEDIVREALQTYLEDLEDIEATEAVLNRIEHGEEGIVTLHELESVRSRHVDC